MIIIIIVIIIITRQIDVLDKRTIGDPLLHISGTKNLYVSCMGPYYTTYVIKCQTNSEKHA